MRNLRFVVVAVALAAVGAFAADPVAQVWFTENQLATRAAPTLITQGASLVGVTSLHGVVQCSDASNITGGSEIAYYYSPGVGAWVPAPTYANFTIPTGGPIAQGPELLVSNPFGRFLYASSGVTCSGGGWDGRVIVTLERAQR